MAKEVLQKRNKSSAKASYKANDKISAKASEKFFEEDFFGITAFCGEIYQPKSPTINIHKKNAKGMSQRGCRGTVQTRFFVIISVPWWGIGAKIDQMPQKAAVMAGDQKPESKQA